MTTLQGQATVARPVLPQPVPLRFKDEVFVRDRIDTRENSVVRLLLEGKALVTIRELSTFTIMALPQPPLPVPPPPGTSPSHDLGFQNKSIQETAAQEGLGGRLAPPAPPPPPPGPPPPPPGPPPVAPPQ